MKERDFENSLNKVSKMLFSYAMKLTKDEDDAKDLYQDTTLRAFRYREKFKVGTNFKAWIFIIMRNIFLNNYHKKKVVSEVFCIQENEYLIPIKINQSKNDAYSAIRLEEITDCIDEIDSKYRDTLMMHYKGFKYQEIADRFRIPLGTVKNRIHVAREKLSRSLHRLDSEAIAV